jgi:taurine dioxygenase
MAYDTIHVRPLTPVLGAEVSDIDLTATLSNHQVDDLHAALAAHQVLFFRDQKIDLEQQKRLGRHFGDLHIHPNTPGPEGHPEILPIHADGQSKRANGENWHSDVSCDAEPPLGSILHLHTVPPVGGDTIFASQTAAYDALTPAFQAFLGGLTATHSGDRSYRRTNKILGIDDSQRVFPQAVHPVVRTHPVTGRKALFVNENFAHSTKPAFQVRFSWQPHSIAFWDNRAVQHIAMWDYFPQVRSGNRVTVKGDRPF